uniref:Uncharacterized protein SEC0017 n=2 Tax=Synechococcus elongatus (strain ATCC 33912 / PCC 7942 / FACHB-805) TaxID=1140 RepID=Q8KPU1_SYNE7|nr:unknown [Synechococcus elongatus PCC 7942 = FACHB-805]
MAIAAMVSPEKPTMRAEQGATVPVLLSARQRRYTWPQRWQRRCRYWYYRALRLETCPKALARGIGLGVFAGCFPLFGLQILIGVSLATILRGNKVLAAAATWISNPFTYLPLFSFNFQLGRLFVPTDNRLLTLEKLSSWQTLQDLGSDFLHALMLGSLLVAIALGFAAYWISLHLAQRHHQQRRHRRAAND